MVIGVTGGIGSGKTVFVRAMGPLGAKVINADDLARRLVNSNSRIRKALKMAFGDGVFDAEGHLKRSELANQVFSDSSKLKMLNAIVWPPLIKAVQAEIRRYRNSDKEHPIVVDMAVLYEAGCEYLFDAVIAVEALPEKRIQWLSKSRGWDETEIRQRMAAQMDVREKSERADWVVENDGDLQSLSRKAQEMLRALCGRREKK
jgi:dephospho-CoA kinase